MQVERVDRCGPEWDAFVESQSGAVAGHAGAWIRVLAEAYRIPALGLLARGASGDVRGVLALALFRTLGGRRELISLPFLDAAGILAADPEAEARLFEQARRLAAELGASSLELRQARPLRAHPGPAGGPRVDLVLPLPADEEELWRSLPAKVRNQTRKARREGLQIANFEATAALDAFYEPFRRNMRRLGSPVHSRAFFAAAQRAFGSRLRFIVACDGSRPVGGLVAIRVAQKVTVPWASTLHSERRRCPNNLIYWEALRWAVAKGAREFDFGRSARGSGTHRFKRGWGAQERELPWLRFAADGRPRPLALPSDQVSARLVARLWSRLPQGLCDRLGPVIRRRISS